MKAIANRRISNMNKSKVSDLVLDWQKKGVEKALKSLEKGEHIGHANVVSWVNSWGAKKEKLKPVN